MTLNPWWISLFAALWLALAQGTSLASAQGASRELRPGTSQPAREANYAAARARVDRAKRLFDVHNYEAAFVDFSRAYELLDGHERRYVVLYNLAVCAERLFRYGEALGFYEQYLAEGGPELQDRETILNVVESLRRLLAVVQVDTQVPGELWIDDRRVGETPGTLRLPAGRHTLEVRARQHESVRRELLLDAGSQTRLQLDLVPLSDYRGLRRGFFYAGAAATGVALLTSIAFGAVTLAQQGRATELARDSMHLRTPELNHANARVSTWALTTDLTFAGTAVLGIGTLLVLALTDWSNSPRESQHAKAYRPCVVSGRASGKTSSSSRSWSAGSSPL